MIVIKKNKKEKYRFILDENFEPIKVKEKGVKNLKKLIKIKDQPGVYKSDEDQPITFKFNIVSLRGLKIEQPLVGSKKRNGQSGKDSGVPSPAMGSPGQGMGGPGSAMGSSGLGQGAPGTTMGSPGSGQGMRSLGQGASVPSRGSSGSSNENSPISKLKEADRIVKELINLAKQKPYNEAAIATVEVSLISALTIFFNLNKAVKKSITLKVAKKLVPGANLAIKTFSELIRNNMAAFVKDKDKDSFY